MTEWVKTDIFKASICRSFVASLEYLTDGLTKLHIFGLAHKMQLALLTNCLNFN